MFIFSGNSISLQSLHHTLTGPGENGAKEGLAYGLAEGGPVRGCRVGQPSESEPELLETLVAQRVLGGVLK